ncbi:aminotransferase-like domain-containing protein [Shewanella halifaxensis]|uniref:aminotransferase-like domain-containing protein n=1 Tax=Shewanella halifaxensis TaxID=271098 RepID=UPI000D592BA0|nr:PLP-dependent aminotransferase family protein [Shewanella halifaxensis]
MGTIWTQNIKGNNEAKYKQIASAAEAAINSGELLANSKLPPQRQLADKLGVTIGTITRAYALLEQRGYVYAKIGAGTFVKATQSVSLNQQANFATCQQPLTDQINLLSDAMNQLAKSPLRLTQLMEYHAEPLDEHKLTFSQWLVRRGIEQSPQQLVFSHGAQQGIFAVLNGLCVAGDTLFCESNSYPGIHVAAEQLGIKVVPISLTADGLELIELEEKLSLFQPKALYLTPNNQNPTCIQYSAEQRQALLELSQAHQVVIIEDDVNYCLPHERSRPLWSMDQEATPIAKQSVIYISSLSKLFCGGLRQGFLLVPQRFIRIIKQAIYSQCWMVSPLNTELACILIENKAFMGDREQQIAKRQQQCIAMGERLGLKQNWRGLNGWLQLKLPLKAHHVVTALAQQGVLIRNGDDFNNHDNHIRLSIGGCGDDAIFLQQLQKIESCINELSQSAYSVV